MPTAASASEDLGAHTYLRAEVAFKEFADLIQRAQHRIDLDPTSVSHNAIQAHRQPAHLLQHLRLHHPLCSLRLVQMLGACSHHAACQHRT
eukprot:1883624-Rhodomonas_salina.3